MAATRSKAYYNFLELQRKINKIIYLAAELESASDAEVNDMLATPAIHKQLKELGLSPLKYHTAGGDRLLPLTMIREKTDYDALYQDYSESIDALMRHSQ